MSHEYFQSCLKNTLNNDTEKCTKRCNKMQTAKHLLIDCQREN